MIFYYKCQRWAFLGWYVDGEEYDFNTPVKDDITITAEWEEN